MSLAIDSIRSKTASWVAIPEDFALQALSLFLPSSRKLKSMSFMVSRIVVGFIMYLVLCCRTVPVSCVSSLWGLFAESVPGPLFRGSCCATG
ncbi:uncharacterized protein BDW43DRAFT_292784 [Aspergillus alliaceus]|uniref:uncharacterized protein n=1 Tax=Petromyces alliaceus TaxID=209559 RepID=UPI0012A6D18E|nr:uncharacterized protein BDW43DRAFT_292784 [Aspergillus alliaceus]KAB8227906.1 hypothetical protein BDW43DRAFT_292784 [Aspergillus alliaceus]